MSHLQQEDCTRNRGGEVHTFTEVAAFGPSFPSSTSSSSGFPGRRSRSSRTSQNLQASDFIAPGGKVKLKNGLVAGVHRFECAIHPWMQSTITVEDEEDED